MRVVLVAGALLAMLVASARSGRDIYRTYERVEHTYDYPEPRKDEDDKQREVEEYWDNVYSGGEGADKDKEGGGGNVQVQMMTSTEAFHDPNVPMCYNCYYNSMDEEGTAACDDARFSGEALITVPCGAGLCAKTRTLYEDGSWMLIRGCQEGCELYNTSMITVECCRGDRCNGPIMRQLTAASANTIALSHRALYCCIVVLYCIAAAALCL